MIESSTTFTPTAPTPSITASFQFQRFSPYSATVVGPLPGLGRAAAVPAADLSAHVAIERPAAPLPVEPEPTPEPVAEAPPAAETEPAPPADAFPPVVTAAVEPMAPTGPLPTPAVDSEPPALILTPLTEAEPLSVQRPVWDEQHREAPAAADQDALFEDEPVEVSILRHEEIIEPRRFDSAQAAFMIMGGTGLFACAASAAAFRIAMNEDSPLGDYTLIAWVLAVIGGVCVIASVVNLYPRLFPPKGE